MSRGPTFAISLVLVLALAACQPGEAMPGDQAAAGGDGAVSQGQAAEPQSQPGAPALPLEPHEIAFTASDGQALDGLYYPAAVNPAPIVVFMHWMGGDKSDWYELAPWLQNRGLENPFENPGDEPWWDPTWFPPVPAGVSYGVLIFSFRGCHPFPEGCTSGTPEEWLLDAQAALLAAMDLEGADPTRIAAIGSSIGADGAPDACAWMAENHPGVCQGALSLSPGHYLDIPYPQAVTALGAAQPPAAAWCLADENEIAVCNGAIDSGNQAFQPFEIPGGSHGNWLLSPDLDPQPMQLILDFLAGAVGP
jgi:hypothetical protein